VDDLGRIGLSVAGDESLPESKSDFYSTPHIEQLARQSMRFSHAYAPAPVCTPSRAGLLAGKIPARLRITTPNRAGAGRPIANRPPPRHVDSAAEGETTNAELLGACGYAAAHFGKWHPAGGGPGGYACDRHHSETGNGGPE